MERAENALLTGTGSQLAFRNFIDMITNKPQKGATVQVTINSKAQQVAYQQLQQALAGQHHQRQAAGRRRGRAQPGHRRDPGHGVLPELRPEPARGARHHQAQHRSTRKLTAQNPSPLLNNATQTTLPPGSTFKIVTSSAWYTQDATRNPKTVIDSPQPLHPAEREHC